MKITFTIQEVFEIIDLLEQYDACTNEEVKLCEKYIKKFQKAQSYSLAGHNKIRYLRRYQDATEASVREESRQEILSLLRKEGAKKE